MALFVSFNYPNSKCAIISEELFLQTKLQILDLYLGFVFF